MSADYSHVPTEGMQRVHRRLLHEAEERYAQRREDLDRHNATLGAVLNCSPGSQQRWAAMRELLQQDALSAADHVAHCLARAWGAGALGELPCLETEARLRAEHGEVRP